MRTEEIASIFESCSTPEQVYTRVIDFGKNLPPFDPSWEVEKNLVSGCQSMMHLHASYNMGKLSYAVQSDALISKGLAALLLAYYNGKTPEFVVRNRPAFLEELGILSNLTPGRANGVASLYLKMKQQAIEACLVSA